MVNVSMQRNIATESALIHWLSKHIWTLCSPAKLFNWQILQLGGGLTDKTPKSGTVSPAKINNDKVAFCSAKYIYTPD